MNNNLLQIKIKQRLNKLASFDYDNIECWMIQEAFNKAQIEWVRRQLHGTNARKEGPEQTINAVDDIQMLLVQKELEAYTKDKFVETKQIPADYLHFVRVSINGQSDCCPKRPFSVYQVEEANVDIMLSDSFKSPSFEWAETFCTVMGDKLRIYTNNSFVVHDINLIYYRKPRNVEFLGCVSPETGVTYKANVISELKDDLVEVIIDEAAGILAGDIESITQYQREIQNSQRNS
jgi:hypothetical protein